MIIVQIAIIFCCLAVGEMVVWLTGWPVPSSIIGMILLTTMLQAGVVKIHQVSGVADFLVKNLGFFFVPAGVGVMEYFDLLRAEWLPIVAAAALSTVIVLGITGHLHQFSHKYLGRRDKSDGK